MQMNEVNIKAISRGEKEMGEKRHLHVGDDERVSDRDSLFNLRASKDVPIIHCGVIWN